jgi:hypothetical protein
LPDSGGADDLLDGISPHAGHRHLVPRVIDRWFRSRSARLDAAAT